jgi:hypothetical protein
MSKYLELVKDSFTQEHFDKQENQKPYVAYSIKDDNVIYNIVPKEDGTMYTIYRVVNKDISNCTYNMVDLGLPSGLKWADRNVGATSPEHYGSYFQWGDTDAYTYDGADEVTAAELASLLQPLVGDEMEVTKDNIGMTLEMMGMTGTDLTLMGIGGVLGKFFNWDSYNEVDVITGWEEDEGGYRYPTGFKKYNNSENGLKVLESVDDAAAVHTNSQLRMPTIDEIRELMDGTTQTFIDVDGNEYIKGTDDINIEQGKLKGVRFTGSNGNSVFIPAAGLCNESLLAGIGVSGELWFSGLYDGSDDNAGSLGFYCDGNVGEGGISRYYGYSVRGVQA